MDIPPVLRWVWTAVILLLVTALGAGGASAQDNAPTQIIVNYNEISETPDTQNVNVFFTVIDSLGRAVFSPNVESAQVTLNNQNFAAQVSVPTTPLNIVLVLDFSGSMRPAWQTMRQAAIDAVNASPQGTRFAVMQFNEQIVTRIGFTEDRNAVVNALSTIVERDFNGGTCLYDATFDAVQLLQAAGAAGRRAVVLFTDGRDELIAGGELDPCSTRSNYNSLVAAARNPQIRVPIFTIGLSGSQAINQSELESMASSTGGLSAFGAQQQLNAMFQQIIQALGSQRQATARICLPAGEYAGFISVEVNNVALNAPIAGVRLNTTCVVPTETPTPIPMSIAVEAFRFNPETSELEFEIVRRGDGVVGQYRVEIIDKNTGFQIDGQYGEFTVTPNDAASLTGNSTLVRVPITGVRAVTWIVTVVALDPNNQEIARAVSGEVTPPRTDTPTPEPTATPTPTPTPVVPVVTISAIQFNTETQEFILNLTTANVSPQNITAYTVRVEDENNIQVFEQTRRQAPPTPLRLLAVDARDRPLPPGRYTITVELLTTSSPIPIRDSREVVKPQGPPPTPVPSFTEQLEANIRQNPVLAGGFVLVVLGIIVLVIVLIVRGRGRRRGGFDRPVYVKTEPKEQKKQKKQKEDFNVEDTTPIVISDLPMLGDKGGKLVLMSGSSADVPNQVWTFTSRDMPLRIGRGGTPDYPVKINLKDPSISANHATIQFANGQYSIVDDGSANGTFVDDELLERGRRYVLESGQVVRLGANTRLMFTSLQDEMKQRYADEQAAQQRAAPGAVPPAAAAAPVAAPAVSGLPAGVSARLTIVQSQDMTKQPGQTFDVNKVEYSIGRAAHNDLAIAAEGVSSRHALLTWRDGQFVLTDQNSTNGTTLNGTRLAKGASAVLEMGKEHNIMLGLNTRLQFTYHAGPPRGSFFTAPATTVEGATMVEKVDTPTAVVTPETLKGAHHGDPLPDGVTAELEIIRGFNLAPGVMKITHTEVTMGRKLENTLAFDSVEISRHHARLLWRGGVFVLEDLGSGNGTFVDDQKLIPNVTVELAPDRDHQIRLGKVEAPALLRFRYSVRGRPSTPPPPSVDPPTIV